MREISKRISVILLCMFCLASLSYTQSTSQYSYKLSESQPLADVLDDLNENMGLVFSFPSDIINQILIDSGDYTAESLDDFISAILQNSDLAFQTMDGHKVLLRPKRTPQNYTKAAETITIKGRVLDGGNRPIGFVDVALDTLYKGATADENGYFSFEIPNTLKNRNLSFHFLGYETKVIQISDFLNQSDITLKQSDLKLDEVVVVEKVPALEIHPIYPMSTTAKADFLNSIQASPFGNDIMRGVQMIAGVSATDDLSSAVKIRGSQDDETLIILDGIPIYKADHFFGIYGAVNGNHVNQVSLHKNSLPVSFGGKTGGMLEMSSKDYIQKISGTADINTLTSSVTLSAPLGKKAGVILSGRTTYDNAAESKFFNWVDPSPEEEIISNSLEGRPLTLETSPIVQFYDLNAKLYFRPTEDHLINFSFFNSQDNYNNSYDIAFANQLSQSRVTGREEFTDMDDWQNLGSSVQYKGSLSNDWTINTNLYYTMFESESALNTSIELTRDNVSFLSNLTNQHTNSVNDIGGNISLDKKLGEDLLTLGVSTVQHDMAFSFSADNNRRFDLNSSEIEGAMFTSYNWQIDDQWKLTLGGRLNYYSATEQLYFGPRLSTSYKSNDQLILKGSFAQHYQFLREVTHYTRSREPIEVFLLTSDDNMGNTYPVGKSTTAMLGATFRKDQWTIDLEVYNKGLEGVIDHTELVVGFNPNDPKPPSRAYKAITGTGRSFGTDLSVGFQSKNYTSWLAYTLSKTTNQFQEIFNNQSIPSEDDRRHQLKLTNQYKFGKWSLSGNYVFASGKSQLNLFDQETILNLKGNLNDNSFSRLPSYNRLDLGVAYKLKLGGSSATIGLNIFNLTNNQNVDYLQYLFAIPRNDRNRDRTVLSGTTTSLLDRTLNLSFKVDW